MQPCLESLLAIGLGDRLEIVVVDNGSKDGSQANIRREFPSVILIENETNNGFAEGSNQGVRASSGEFVLLLNADTIVNPSLLGLVQVLQSDPNVGAAGGMLLNSDGSFQSALSEFSSLMQELLIASSLGSRLWPGYPSHLRKAEQPGWLCAACILLRRAALVQVGLLDPEFFMYGEETDLQYRLSRAGWSIRFVPDVTTIHYGGASQDRWRRRRMVYRGKLLFYRKNYSVAKAMALRALLVLATIAKLPVWMLAAMRPGARQTAVRELNSNIEILKLCLDSSLSQSKASAA